jgi:uncharacterized membrane protein YccC
MDDHSARLRATILELEQELRAVSEVDTETRAMLAEAIEEIQATLHTAPEPAEGTSDEPDTLNERLTQAAADFDVSHPTLASLVRRVVDLLGQIGI